MDLKLSSPSELLIQIEKMISESPVLSQEKTLSTELLQTAKTLEIDQLKELFELLQEEQTDWQSYFEKLKKEKEKILLTAGNESLQIQKDVEKTVLKAEESISEEEDTTRAEQLLKQL